MNLASTTLVAVGKRRRLSEVLSLYNVLNQNKKTALNLLTCCRSQQLSTQPNPQQPRGSNKIIGRNTSSMTSYDALFEKIADQYSTGKNTVAQYVSILRTKAALSLTSSLNEDDRRRVLQAIHAIDVTQAKEESTRSVGEAVAKVMAEEARKKDQQDGDILRRAEEAAMARVANEIKIQEQRLEEERYKLKQKEKELTCQQQQQQQQQLDLQQSVAAIDNDNDHPILGPAIADLGYKRVHLVNGSILSTIPVWEKQRTYRHDRAKLMAQDKMKTKHIGLPGVITLHETKDGHLSILDGQHRVGMILVLMEKMQQQHSSSTAAATTARYPAVGFDYLDKILVEVFPEKQLQQQQQVLVSSSNTTTTTTTTSSAADIFTEINKAEPVKLVDLPGIAKVSERKIINEAAAALTMKYPAMFKSSQRCRSPHLNTDNLRDALFTANILKKHEDSIKSSTDLLQWLEDHNATLGQKYNQVYGASSKNNSNSATNAAISKAIENEFYLGLESTWLF